MKNIKTGIVFLLIISSISCLSSEKDKSIKSITATYTNHKPNAEVANDSIVAIVNIKMDGTIDSLVQYREYPYGIYSEKWKREFWASPILENLPIILSGIDIGYAEINFLHGNDWSKIFAMKIRKSGHPKYPKSNFMFKDFESFVYINESTSLPNEIETKIDYDKFEGTIGVSLHELFETFTYQDNRVTQYEIKYLPNKKFMRKTYATEIVKYGESYLDTEISKYPPETIYFEYNGNLLISVTEQFKTYKFYYDEKQLVKFEVYADVVLLSMNKYYYNKNKECVKTEIYSRDKNLEYTINYQYEFH